MKKIITSGLSLVIAAVLCLSLLPMTALAADSDFTIENGVLIQYNGSGGAVLIPNSVTTIADGAFFECRGLTSITIPDSVTSIGSNDGSTKNPGAFMNCSNLTSVTIPSSVMTIGAVAFRGCTGLTSVTIPNSVTSIGYGAFSDCTGLTSVTIGNGIKSYVGDYGWGGLLDGCTSLTNVTFSNGFTTILDSMFSGCTALTNITIPDSVASIGYQAFYDCKGLTSITIPDSVTNIGDSAFSYWAGGESKPLPSLTIHGKTGSAAEIFANKNGFTFVSTGGTTPPTPTEPITPTEKPSSWAETDVTTAIAANIVPQDLQEKYTQATTRAEFCALAVALYETVTGKEITERQTFTDTSDINVEKAAAIGVVSGIGDNKFSPNATLTREQAATMLSRLANAVGKPLTQQAATFADNDSISSWAVEAVGQMQAAGVMGGVGNNTFSSKGDYTREQSIVTILRLYDVVKSSGGAGTGEAETKTYPMYSDYPSIPDFGAIFGVELDHSDKTLGIPAFYYTLEYEKYEGGYASGLLNDFSAYEVYKELSEQYTSVLKECGFTENVAQSVGGNYLSYWKGHGYSVLVSFMEYERSTTEPKLKVTIQKI